MYTSIVRTKNSILKNYAPITVKPEGGEGGQATHGNLTVTHIPLGWGF